jgi:hypothetical protein
MMGLHHVTIGTLIFAAAPYSPFVVYILLILSGQAGAAHSPSLQGLLQISLSVAPIFALPLALWAMMRPLIKPLCPGQ